MELGISFYRSEVLSYEEQAKLYKKYGVNHTFIMSNHPDFDKLMVVFREHGLICDNLHAPYKGINNMWREDEELAQNMLVQFYDCVDKCAQNGIPAMVLHTSTGKFFTEVNELGVKRFKKLFDYAAEKGVTIALENQRITGLLGYFMDHFDDLKFCWDCGHEYGVSGVVGFMKMYGRRLAALHIHDNRCRKDANGCDIDTDDHLLPFESKIDFDDVAKQIAESGYDGAMMLEVSRYEVIDDKAVYGHLTDEQFIARAAAAAGKLRDMIHSYRENV